MSRCQLMIFCLEGIYSFGNYFELFLFDLDSSFWNWAYTFPLKNCFLHHHFFPLKPIIEIFGRWVGEMLTETPGMSFIPMIAFESKVHFKHSILWNLVLFSDVEFSLFILYFAMALNSRNFQCQWVALWSIFFCWTDLFPDYSVHQEDQRSPFYSDWFWVLRFYSNFHYFVWANFWRRCPSISFSHLKPSVLACQLWNWF